MTDQKAPPEKFGTVLGMAPGNVPVYSSDYKSADDSEFPDRESYRSFVGGIYMGQKWQCVEFARRWLYTNHGYVFDEVAMAYDIFRLRTVHKLATGERLPLRAFRNGSPRWPEPGCLLIWDEGGDFATTGHVAVVTEIAENRLRVVEQNVGHHGWEPGRDYSREIAVNITAAGEVWLECSFDSATILGWVIQTDDDLHAEEIHDVDARLLNLELRELEPRPDPAAQYLDPAAPEEAAYVAMMGSHMLASDPADVGKYVCMSESALAELKRATEELHALFMAATEHVLRNESLFSKFNIPRALWPRIQQSWSNRRNEVITGRFDFAVSERGIKVYEYNCDSASCHLECGKVQGKWARHFGCDDGFDAGRSFEERLLRAWRKAQVDGVLHIMHDNDPEETYHALYMQGIIGHAGIQTKLIDGLAGLSWDRDGNICDADGTRIRWVWKTWAWETALDQIRAECEDDEAELQSDRPGRARHGAPRLADVLLRPDVMVYEPLWTLIPSNKAILPVLWRLCPNHPYLLESTFELRETLEKTGYAIKPIVGRGGANISLVDPSSKVIAETGGRFEDRDAVYQQIWRLPKLDGLNVQISTFSAAGSYGGSCTRVDSSPVINMDSSCLPLRVVPDESFGREAGR